MADIISSAKRKKERLKNHNLGDLESEPAPGHVVCVDNVKDFTEAFLFSLETQHTIG